MASRLELQTTLEAVLESENVYFQSPPDIQMQYPCIMYKRDESQANHANNKLYLHTKRYQVTVVDRDPDSELPDQVEALPYCSFDRQFAADDLNHWVYTLFF